MKILHLIAPAAAGGAESAVRSLVIGQLSLGHDVEVAALTSRSTGPHPFVEQLRQDGITVHDLRPGRRDYLAESRMVGDLLPRRRADVLHTHVYHADSVGYVAASNAKVPQVATMHGFTGGGLRLQAYARFDMWILRRCAAVIAVADTVRDTAIGDGIDPERLHVIPNGYEPARKPVDRLIARCRLGLPQSGPVIGWIGRLSKEKGADIALEAFAAMPPGSATLSIVGDGFERVNLELIARHLKLYSDRVRFAGQVNGASNLLSAFDVLAVSSRTEGTPMVVLEAMAARLPIAAFTVGGIGHMLTPSSALLVTPGDAPALGRALSYALACPSASKARAEAAHRAFTERFGIETCARAVLDVYERVIRARSAPKGARIAPATHWTLPHPNARTYRSAST